jgi:glycosyltransferase involved in cell wall biosynthesis
VKIAYACYLTGGHPDGVGTKIEAQLRAWRSAGHEASQFLLAPWLPEGQRRAIEGETFMFRGLLERTVATRGLFAAVRRSAPDIVYLRYDLFVPPPSLLARAAPTVVEFNSNAQAEWRSRSRAAAAYERFQESLLLRRARGAVCVGHELAARVERLRPALPVRVIANGVELEDLPVFPPPETDGIRVAWLGEDGYWQGVDKLFELAEALPEWQFDLVGIAPERSRANVRCYGVLGPEAYEPILAKADVAVATLALHRKGMEETSALKVPRYLGYGLPVILGYTDTDFAGFDPWYLLRLPNTESNVREGIERIRSFGAAVKGRRVDRSEIAARVSVKVKEQARLAFFAELIGAR